MGRLYYITGGAGSGKSEYAEQLAERLHTELVGPLYYVATMNPAPRDSDAAARIAKHQKRRAGRGYTTLECPTDIAQLRTQALKNAVFLLEDLTNLYANEVYGMSGHPHEIVAPLLDWRTIPRTSSTATASTTGRRPTAFCATSPTSPRRSASPPTR